VTAPVSDRFTLRQAGPRSSSMIWAELRGTPLWSSWVVDVASVTRSVGLPVLDSGPASGLPA
jgi:hypothetical protein